MPFLQRILLAGCAMAFTAAGCGRERGSPLAEKVLASDPYRWRHVEGRFVLVHAQTGAAPAELGRAADFAFERAGYRLQIPAPPEKAHVYLVRKSETWSRLLSEANLRPDGLALHDRSDVFIRESPEIMENLLQVCHEMVHLRLWLAYQDRVPLWLEEGLAIHWSWELVREYKQSADIHVVRSPAPLPDLTLYTLEELTAMSAYPADAEHGKIFYRQAEALVAELAARLEKTQLAGFIKQSGAPGAGWREVLRDEFGFTPEHMADWENGAARNVRPAGHGP